MKKIDIKIVLFLHLVISLLILCVALPDVAHAEGCLHTNIDRSTIEMYEQIIDNDKAHELTCWMTTMCLDCGAVISDVALFSQEEPHQFVEDGSVLTCKWCEYQSRKETSQTTPAPIPATETLTASATGMLSDVIVTIILNANGVIENIAVDTSDEFGYLCTEADFLSQFIGKKGPFENIDVATGATITSKAVMEAVNMAITNDTQKTTATPVPTLLDTEYTSGDYKYKLYSNGDAIITKYLGSDSFLIIPDTIDGHVVRELGSFSFRSCEKLKNVVIPASVVSIRKEAFFYCEEITSMEIPNGVVRIEEYAFEGCKALKSIVIPESVVHIGAFAFVGCNALTNITVNSGNTAYYVIEDMLISKVDQEVVAYPPANSRKAVDIPQGITKIGDCAFANCINLTSITIPNSVVGIGVSGIFGCTALTSITLPESVVTIGDRAFEQCNALTSVILSDSTTDIGRQAFAMCYSIKELYIPESVVAIGESAFTQCLSLTSITIPNSITSIAPKTFLGCRNLKSIMVGNNVTSIGKNAFWGCYNLIIVCPRESYAWQYAIDNNIPVKTR